MINRNRLKFAVAALAMAAAAHADSASVKFFHYSPGISHGYHLAYADSDSTYKHLGQLFSSDYSRWGSEKKMHHPVMLARKGGGAVAVFQVNDYSPCFAVAVSEDFVTWRPQDYPRMSSECIAPVIYLDHNSERYVVLYKTKDGRVRKTTSDLNLRHFTPDVEANAADYDHCKGTFLKDTAIIDGKKYAGDTFTLTGNADNIFKHFQMIDESNRRNAESLRDDEKRFASILGKQQKAVLTIDASDSKAISDKLIGVFFEDISYAADGGLYAELVQNRDFEYRKGEGRHKDWGPLFAWRSTGDLQIVSDAPLSVNNKNHILVSSDTLYNSGWDGIKVDKGAVYDFSFYVNHKQVKSKRFSVALVADGKIVGSVSVKTKGKIGQWNRYSACLTAADNAKAAELMIVPEGKGLVALDMISLFPRETFCNRKNGLRKDLAQAIADLKPRFIRFPGGCMSHGDGLDNIYHWHHTVGPLQDRMPDANIWRYHQTRGLGFFEYFQFCEDIGAEPLPVLAAGVPCQNSGPDCHGYGGQQGGIPMEKMPEYVQEFLDMIEWANGDPATSKWAKMRADAGHPEPFNLKYVGVGNEDLISTVFEERCLMIAKAVKERYPEIIVCGTVGPFHYPSSDYIEGWRFANEHKSVFDMVDEHYYESVGWFLNNQRYYDNYDRRAPKVYLGEYAARVGKGGLDCALAEAVHLCNIERNADVVTMTSYAPLLSKNGHSNWSPDMMYFDNHRIDKTPSYWTQYLFGNFAGDMHISSRVSAPDAIKNRIAASVVKDTQTGKSYLKVANVLPVELSLDIQGTVSSATVMNWHGFSGQPGQQRVEMTSGTITGNTIVLPPYSFRVVEL